MATDTLKGGIRPENPESEWLHVCDTWDMARKDMDEAGDTDDEINLYGLAYCEAYCALIRTPAPNAAALARKLEVFRDEEAYGLVREAVDEFIGVMIDDVNRIGGRA
jgi:hypothetical protein